jgi:hypothetical protein
MMDGLRLTLNVDRPIDFDSHDDEKANNDISDHEPIPTIIEQLPN